MHESGVNTVTKKRIAARCHAVHRLFAEIFEINFISAIVLSRRTAAAVGFFVPCSVDAVVVKPFDPRLVAILSAARWMNDLLTTVLAMHAMEPKRW